VESAAAGGTARKTRPGRPVEPPVGIEPTTFSLRAASTGVLNLLVSVNHGWEYRYPERIFQSGGPPGGHAPTTWLAWSGPKTYEILADIGSLGSSPEDRVTAVLAVVEQGPGCSSFAACAGTRGLQVLVTPIDRPQLG
jgi:hypothetical protein